MSAEQRLKRLERRRPKVVDPVHLFIRTVSPDLEPGEFVSVVSPRAGRISREQGEREGAFLRRAFHALRALKPLSEMTDNEYLEAMASESEQAALSLANEDTIPAELHADLASRLGAAPRSFPAVAKGN
ncbi:hypothetical protein LCM08_00510 [Salipiger pacificus]|nr:hypothetical protein [Alloyangia pacifica]